jgi:pimeloyl-ACP methyl ester carboxylesterase
METVLLVHSSGMSSRQWRSFADDLAAGANVMAPDLLGSGKNPRWPPDAPFDFHMDVDELARRLEPLGRPAHLVGHSYGGLVALTIARKYPALVRSLALYDPVAFGVLYDPPDAEGLGDLLRTAANPVFSDDARGGGEEWFEAFVDYWNGVGTYRTLPGPTRAAFLEVGRKVYLEVRSLMADRTPMRDYAHLAIPVLLLSGERSPVAVHRVAARLAEALPNARRATIAGAGHMGPITHVADVNAAILAHLAS